MFESWIFWALAAAVFWGVGAIFSKKALATFTPLVYNLLTVPLDILLLLPFALAFGLNLGRFTLVDFLLLIFITTSYTLYYYVISLNKLALSGTVLSTYPLVTMFFAILLLGEKLTGVQLVWILVLVTGVVLIGLPTSEIPDPDLRARSGFRIFFQGWFLAALGMAIFSGLADFLAKGLIDRVGVGNYLFFYGWAFIPSNLVAFFLDKRGRVWPRLKFQEWPLALLGAALLVLGSGFFFTAVSFGPVSLVAPISSLYAAITVILSFIFLKERLTKVQALGVALAVTGVIMIGT